MDPEEPPTNVFQFPPRFESAGQSADDAPFAVGAFVDRYGPAIFDPVSALDDKTLATMLHEFQKHRALVDMLISLMAAEQHSRR